MVLGLFAVGMLCVRGFYGGVWWGWRTLAVTKNVYVHQGQKDSVMKIFKKLCIHIYLYCKNYYYKLLNY